MSVRVLVVDDSALMRALITRKLETEPDIEVIGTAAEAKEARAKIKSLNPDVITLDIEMPGMNGLAFLEKIMALRPTPVIIVSGSTQDGAEATARALGLGAVSCYSKSANGRSLRDDDGGELAGQVRAAAAVHFARPKRAAFAPSANADCAKAKQNHGSHSNPYQKWHAPPALIAIGASTGGVEALHTLLCDFPSKCPPTVIVQHINACFAPAIAASLDQSTKARVVAAHHDLVLEPGMIAIAPGNDRHMGIAHSAAGGYRCVLVSGDLISGHRPSVDRLFCSVAETAGDRALGILLTGMGKDGAEGMLTMARAHARTIAQDQSTCVVFGMPRAAIELGAASDVLPLGSIAQKVFARKGVPA